MLTTTAKNARKAVSKVKPDSETPVVNQDDVIVQKTYHMAETMKKYALPRK